jgi:hypothetical protein
MEKNTTAQAPAASQPKNFVAHLSALARTRADDIWLTVVGEADGQHSENAISYGAFERRVRALAARLQQQFAKGERALVMLDNGDHYAVSMLACFYSGVIAVPAFPPESARPGQWFPAPQASGWSPTRPGRSRASTRIRTRWSPRSRWLPDRARSFSGTTQSG